MTEEEPRYGGRLGKNPVAWIVLLVLVVYALACLVLATASDLRDFDRSVLIAFVVLFPVLILVMFVRPVARQASAPAGPADAGDEATFLAVMSLLLNAQLERAGDERSPVVQAEETAAAVFAARRRLESHPGTGLRLLWIDGRSDTNNLLERQAFERLGVNVDSPSGTNGAQAGLQNGEYDAIVLAEGGSEDDVWNRYQTIEAIPSGGDRSTPVFVYTESNREDHRADAVNRGAQDATSRPLALFDMVMRSVA
jgi:hypothetical protein